MFLYSILCAVLFIFQNFQQTEEVVIQDSTIEDYIKSVVAAFRENPTNERFDSVIEAPRLGRRHEQNFLLPKIFIWCPMEHFSLDIFCPHHNLPLKPGFFTDELSKKSPRNPRLVYDLRGNILLIQRVYVCKQGGIHHKYLSASMDILRCIPKLHGIGCFPLVMFYKSACTKVLVDFIETQIIQGVNFLQISSGIAAANFKEYSERIERYTLFHKHCRNESDHNHFDGFYSNVLFSFPSNDKIMEIFLADFNAKEPYYKKEMEKCARASRTLTCDHTFRISKYIGASRSSDKRFVRQFENVFIVMNEKRQVVGWRLTRSTAFEEIKDFFQDLKSVLSEGLETVIVDDCCKVRKQYQSVFPGVVVKLDLFHAVQRVVKTFPKGTETSRQISKDFGLIFRKDGDCGNLRNQQTPEPEIIEQNLNNFLIRWRELLNCDAQTKTLQEVENLKTHIRKGCLSGLPPGQGTECNERLHHTLNESLLCGATTISPEIAVAVLSLIFYGLNVKKMGKKHQGNAKVVPFMPLPKYSLTESAAGEEKTSYFKSVTQEAEHSLDYRVWEQCKVKNTNNRNTDSIELVVIETIGDMFNDFVAGVICENTLMLFSTLEKVKKQCKDRSFNVMDIPWMQLTGKKNVLLTDSGDNNIAQSEHLLCRNLTSLNLSRDPVAGDGDCAFASIIKQLRKSKEWQEETTFKSHLTNLGLGGSFDEDVHQLRQIFVNAVQSSEDYQQMLGVDQQEMNYETERFRDDGTYCGEMGDLIIKVCSDVLKIPILVVTNIPGSPYIPFVPEQQSMTEMLCMSFNAYGPGHYDATSLNNDEENANEAASSGQRKTVCSCGRNKKEQSESFCIPFDTDNVRAGRKCPCVMEGSSCCNSCRCKGCKNMEDKSTDTNKAQTSCRCGESAKSKESVACNNTARKTKCPCFKNKRPCGENCFCKNCKNEYGQRIGVDIPRSPATKRKRSNPSPFKKMKSADYLLGKGSMPTSSVWTEYETCMLFIVMKTIMASLVPLSVDNVTSLYNHVVQSKFCEETKLPVRYKKKNQIQGKLRQIEEKQIVVLVKANGRSGEH